MNDFLLIIKKYWWIILLGLVIRLILSATTFHLDVKAQMVASAAYFHGQWDTYQFARQIHPDTVLDKLPMSYFIDFPLRLPLHFLVDDNKEKVFLLSPSKLLGDTWLFGYLIYAKIPFVLVDLLIGVLLAMSVSAHLQKRVLYIWMFNPFTLWATSMIGQIDVYITFFILFSYLLIKRSQFYFAAFILGIGGAIKFAPLLLVPLLFGMVSTWKTRSIIVLLSVLPYFVTVLLYLPSFYFRHDALFAPQLSKMLYVQLPLSGGESIFITLALLVFLYLLFFSKPRSSTDFSKYAIAIYLMILSLTHFHLQWILWPMPLLVLWLMDHWHDDIKLALLGGTVSFIGMLFLFEASLQCRLFAPLFPILDQAPGLKEVLTDSQVIFLRSITASIFAASSGFLIWRILKQ